jgi:hypothetical protein
MATYAEFEPVNLHVLEGVTTDLRGRFALDGTPAHTGTETTGAVVVTGLVNGSIVDDTATESPDGIWAIQVPGADIADVDVVTAVWTIVDNSITYTFTAEHEVRGDLLFTIDQVRRFDTQKVTDAILDDSGVVQCRDLIWEFFEDYCNVAFGTAYKQTTLDGTGDLTIWLPSHQITAVKSLTIGGSSVTIDSDVKVYDYGMLYSAGGFTADRQNVVVGYEHGYTRIPGVIRRAAMTMLKDSLLPSNIASRAHLITDETGTYRLSIPGLPDRPTGIPEVDFVLNDYRIPVVV